VDRYASEVKKDKDRDKDAHRGRSRAEDRPLAEED
jgi:hypothetical protein